MGNIDLLAAQARQTGAGFAVTADPWRYQDLKSALPGSGIEAGAGPSALIEAGERETDLLIAGIVGIAGLAPTLAAVSNGADIALANKECLVSAGDLFAAAMTDGGGKLLPVDSEHNAIFQVLEENQQHAVERIILTASGGPFREYTREQMAAVTRRHRGCTPELVDGSEDLDRQRIDVQQGARDDRGSASVRHAAGADRGHRSSAIHHPFDGRLQRRLGAGPARRTRYASRHRLRHFPSAPRQSSGRAA
jgi:hypothetical protein